MNPYKYGFFIVSSIMFFIIFFADKKVEVYESIAIEAIDQTAECVAAYERSQKAVEEGIYTVTACVQELKDVCTQGQRCSKRPYTAL